MIEMKSRTLLWCLESKNDKENLGRGHDDPDERMIEMKSMMWLRWSKSNDHKENLGCGHDDRYQRKLKKN